MPALRQAAQRRTAEQAGRQTPGSSATVVRIVRPERRTIDYAVDQPGFVDAYEQTPIFSKVSGFIKQFYVDIGDEVKKGELLAEIFVPELDEEHQQKVAQVELDESMVEQAEQLVVVARSNIQMATAQLAEAKADVGKYQAEVVRWESEVQTLDRNGAGEGRRQASARRDAETTRFEQGRPRRRAGRRGRPRGRRGHRRGQLGKGEDRRGDRQGRRSGWPRPTSAARRPCWPIPR